MRIGIDGRCLVGEQAGIGKYAHNLIKALVELDKSNEYFLYFNVVRNREKEKLRQRCFISGARMTNRILTVPHRFTRICDFVMDRLAIPWALRRDKIDLFFSPTFCSVINLPSETRMVVTVHDVIYRLYPDFFPDYTKRRLKALGETLIRANKIIADSESTKRDILKFFGVQANNIVVVYPGVSDSFHVVNDTKLIGSIRQRYNLSEPFMLFVGTLEPRKNLVGLIEAYSKLRKTMDLKHKLVIVGRKGWDYHPIFRRVEELKLRQDILFLGYLPEEDLPFLYNCADLSVYPSIYEGFGLPPLEAMACGCPVVTSNTSSLPEVVGEAAVLVNPQDIDDIAWGIRQVLEDLERKRDLIRKGLRRSRLFSWSKAARETLAIFENIY
ncbi:MAG: glycosyltransferase family 1 protein [bacterium]|nr:glycosyltransferase family 1 protein [bacterium]